jgi:gamma-glutamyltranspeptidase/glutathione hydrolase
MKLKRFAVAAALVILGCAGSRPPTAQEPFSSVGTRFMVAADHPLASQAGAQMFDRGGNVVDAAVATSLALAVVRPYSTGLGGGGFMIVHLKGSEPIAIDYRETAPEAAANEAYLDDDNEVIPNKTNIGHSAVATPGLLRGLSYALKKFGTLPLETVIAPAIELAENGVRVDAHTNEAMISLAELVEQHGAERFGEISKTFLKGGKPFEVGEVLVQPDLAQTLRRIAREGTEDFYRGEIAAQIASEMQANLGPLTVKDLSEYEVKVRRPLVVEFRGYDVYGMPPPSSGGACVQQILNVMDGYDPSRLRPARYTHILVEAMKHAFADRASFLGDSDFHPKVIEDVQRMLSPETAKAVRAAIEEGKTSNPSRYGSAWLSEDGGTSHYSIIDAKGNAVAATETINLTFGSLVMPKGTGIVLNDEMDDFAVKTDAPNAFGLIMSKRNLIEPKKRPLSSMSPTIVLQDGKAIMAVGASGGPKIITATLQTLLQVIDFNQPVDAAVSAKRVHHQWSPDELKVEEGVNKEILETLRKAGHAIAMTEKPLGVSQVVVNMDGSLAGASDPRKGGRPAGK